MKYTHSAAFPSPSHSCPAVVQYFLSPLLLAPGSILAVLLSNGLFLTAFTYYHYLNFLGYDGTQHPGTLLTSALP